MNFATLTRLTIGNLTRRWANHAPKVWIEPHVIQDGFHDYVIMSSVEFDRLKRFEAAGERITNQGGLETLEDMAGFVEVVRPRLTEDVQSQAVGLLGAVGIQITQDDPEEAAGRAAYEDDTAKYPLTHGTRPWSALDPSDRVFWAEQAKRRSTPCVDLGGGI